MAEQKRRRNTRQRQVVLDELRKLATHPTAAELYELTRRRLPKISLGTVYRNLELLVRRGVIRKIETGDSEARFDGKVHRHHHVRCLRCGRVDDAHALLANPMNVIGGQVNDYEILGFRLEFVGVCRECRRQPVPDEGETPSLENE